MVPFGCAAANNIRGGRSHEACDEDDLGPTEDPGRIGASIAAFVVLQSGENLRFETPRDPRRVVMADEGINPLGPHTISGEPWAQSISAT